MAEIPAGVRLCPLCGGEAHRYVGRDYNFWQCDSCAEEWQTGTEPKPRAALTRDSLLARLSDVLRRSGVEDAENLIAEVERRVPRPRDPRAYVQTITPKAANALLGKLGFLSGEYFITEPIEMAEAPDPAD